MQSILSDSNIIFYVSLRPEGKDDPKGDFAIYTANRLIGENLKFIASKGKMIEKQEQPDLYHFALGFFNLLPQMSPGKELLLKSLVIPDDSRLYPILRYLTDHVQEELRMDEVALRYNLSTRNLSRLFQESNIHFSSYVNRLRIMRAIELMTDGGRTMQEIAYAVGFNKELSGYLKNLSEEYGLISKKQPLYERSVNKNVHYTIEDQFLRFWFRFVYKYSHIIEAGANEKLKSIAERDFPTVSGKSLECYFMEVLKEQGCYTRLGYWNDRKGENEIDIIAEDEVDNKIEFIEVKRQSKNFDEELLKSKAATFMKAVGPYEGYEISYKGISIDDM